MTPTPLTVILQIIERDIEFHKKASEVSRDDSYHSGMFIYLVDLRRKVLEFGIVYEKEELLTMYKMGREDKEGEEVMDKEKVFKARYVDINVERK